MGNSGSSANAAETIFKDKSLNDYQPKNRNEISLQRGNSGKFTRAKVLPDLGSPLRLRRTNNGDILHNGGTISARKQEYNNSTKFERDILYGSEPDLRITANALESIYVNCNTSKLRSSKCRKKYRAPKAPQNTVGSSSPDSYQAENEQVSRRLRLFKTKKQCQKINQDEFKSYQRFTHPIPYLQRSLSTPQFDAELLPAVQKKQTNSSDDNSLNKFKTEWTQYDVNKSKFPIRILSKKYKNNDNNNFEILNKNFDFLNRIPSNQQNKRGPNKIETPAKRFYFGMELNTNLSDSKIVDNFKNKSHFNDYYSDFLSLPNSEPLDMIGIDNNQDGISVQLRATLPRKQLDIPQFSPLTAWRLLSCGEIITKNCDNSTIFENDYNNSNNDMHSSNNFNNHIILVDKSQDSGISADDSPRIDSQAAWTPQQDLEETSSDGGFPQFSNLPTENCQIARFSPRFILSLPRDDRLNIYSEQFKGVFNENLHKEREEVDINRNSSNSSPLIDSNWVLSRSMPSLLNATSLCKTRSVDINFHDEDVTSSLIKQPSFSYLANGGHIMYLPEYSKYRISERNGRSSAPATNNTISKSCEDVIAELSKESVNIEKIDNKLPKINKIEKKFTFQSTIRQLERKRLAEKLSKEAETKENERRLEIEAMRKAEEEFQKKREKEKIGIRQQLRLFSLSGNPSSTQILSEYHMPSRDYKDYRNNKFNADRDSPTSDSRKKSTIYPAVTYQIPKSTQIYFNPRSNSDKNGEIITNQILGIDNYRKKFAQGDLNTSINISEDHQINFKTQYIEKNT